jgi:hypothetical protein
VLDRTALAPARPNRLGRFAMLSEAALVRLAGQDGALALYARLALAAFQQGRASAAHGQSCIVSVRRLAADLDCSDRTVQRRLAVLVDAGLLSVLPRTDRRGRALESEYVFRYPADGPATRSVPHAAPGGAQGADSAAADGVPYAGAGDAPVAPTEESRETTITSPEAARAVLRARGVFRATPAPAATTGPCPVGPAPAAVRPSLAAPAGTDAPPAPPPAAPAPPAARAVPPSPGPSGGARTQPRPRSDGRTPAGRTAPRWPTAPGAARLSDALRATGWAAASG